MARARRSTALKVKSYAQESGSEGGEEEEEMQVESSEFEETASTGSKRSIRMEEDAFVEDVEGQSHSPSHSPSSSLLLKPHSDPFLPLPPSRRVYSGREAEEYEQR